MLVRIWYTENRYFEVENLEQWKALPATEIVLVWVEHGAYRYRVSGGDWYYWQDNKIKHVSSGPWGTWVPRPPIDCAECVKQGIGVSDEEFKRISELGNGY